MTRVIDVVPRTRKLRSMRVILGVTTKQDIIAFCPRANVGVKAELVDGRLFEDEKDIRWVSVPHNGELWDGLRTDGDWIVEEAPGHFFIYSDADYHRKFVML